MAGPALRQAPGSEILDACAGTGDEGRTFNAPSPFAAAHTLLREWAKGWR